MKHCDVMEKSRLSAGLQSFLAWHNLCLVMTVYSLLTLTESLARTNCVCDFSPCVLTWRNRRKLQHLLWSNSISFHLARAGLFMPQTLTPASSKYQSDHKIVPACKQLGRNEFQLFTRNNGLSREWQDNCPPHFPPQGTFSHISDDCLLAMHFHWWISDVMASQ